MKKLETTFLYTRSAESDIISNEIAQQVPWDNKSLLPFKICLGLKNNDQFVNPLQPNSCFYLPLTFTVTATITFNMIVNNITVTAGHYHTVTVAISNKYNVVILGTN